MVDSRLMVTPCKRCQDMIDTVEVVLFLGCVVNFVITVSVNAVVCSRYEAGRLVMLCTS